MTRRRAAGGLVFAGDLGGTKSSLAVFRARRDGTLEPVAEEVLRSEEHADADAMLRGFLAPHRRRVDAACLAVAGPVRDGRVETTNLPWTLTQRRLAAIAGTPRARLVNDLEAAAVALPHLPARAFRTLQRGRRPPGPGSLAVIAPGTGLGVAFLCSDGRRHHAVASEGGHRDFAPRGAEQAALLEWLARRHRGHVSYERVLSGDGLRAVHDFLRETGRLAEPAWMRERLRTAEDPNAAIAEAALAGRPPICVRALRIFVEVLGAEAGNLALGYLPTAGVVIGGGIAPRILPALRGEAFLEAFRGKGRFAGMMGQVPVRVALDPRAPLLGAARLAVAGARDEEAG